MLIEIDGIKYYVTVSSPKEKHNKMSNGLDFHKVVDDKSGTLYAVININNMIPVPDKCIMQLKYNDVQNHRTFANEKETYCNESWRYI
nr:type III toxin-antitoxin system ToxN/AbiQ family toxin [uncultured Eubacterium sp.]